MAFKDLQGFVLPCLSRSVGGQDMIMMIYHPANGMNLHTFVQCLAKRMVLRVPIETFEVDINYLGQY